MTRESQIENYRTRARIDASLRADEAALRDRYRPKMVGFQAMLSGLSEFDESTIEGHVLVTGDPWFLMLTNMGTTRLIGLLWPFEEGSDPYP